MDNILHQLKHMNTGLDSSEWFLYQWRRTLRTKKFEDAEMQKLLDKNSTQSTTEMDKVLNID